MLLSDRISISWNQGMQFWVQRRALKDNKSQAQAKKQQLIGAYVDVF